MSPELLEHPGWALAAAVILFGATGGILLHYNLRLKRSWVRYGFTTFWFLIGLVALCILGVQYSRTYWDADFPDPDTVRLKRLAPFRPVVLDRGAARAVDLPADQGPVTADPGASGPRRLHIVTRKGTVYRSAPGVAPERLQLISDRIEALGGGFD